MTIDDLRLFLAFPLVSTIILTVGPLFAPAVRWSRRLRSDLDIMSKLPPGPERDEFERAAKALARKIIDYRTRIPAWDKAVSWLFVCAASFLLAVFIANPEVFLTSPDIPGSPGTTIALLIGFVLSAGIGVYGAFSGRTSRGLTPDQHDEYVARERERMRSIRRRPRANAEAPEPPIEPRA